MKSVARYFCNELRFAPWRLKRVSGRWPREDMGRIRHGFSPMDEIKFQIYKELRKEFPQPKTGKK